MRFPCSLCESLDHFTYHFPIIIEYRMHQLMLCQRPTELDVDLLSSLSSLLLVSLKLEALPMPLWFLDDLSEDYIPNSPNSPAYFPLEILHPTTMGTPQYFDIWFMSIEPSLFPCVLPPASSSLGGSNNPIPTLDAS
jgi:hypothetical protein